MLARSSPSRIVAVDNHPPFIDALNREVRRQSITDRIEARVADMRSLDFPDRSFDLIWCEGAIYNMGVEAGLRDWRRLLRRHGHVALTEVCWLKPEPPAACAAFWNREYPAIRDTSALLEAAEGCGYETVGHFPLPASAWWDDYYRPLQDNVTAFRWRHPDEPDAQDLADQCHFTLAGAGGLAGSLPSPGGRGALHHSSAKWPWGEYPAGLREPRADALRRSLRLASASAAVILRLRHVAAGRHGVGSPPHTSTTKQGVPEFRVLQHRGRVAADRGAGRGRLWSSERSPVDRSPRGDGGGASTSNGSRS